MSYRGNNIWLDNKQTNKQIDGRVGPPNNIIASLTLPDDKGINIHSLKKLCLVLPIIKCTLPSCKIILVFHSFSSYELGLWQSWKKFAFVKCEFHDTNSFECKFNQKLTILKYTFCRSLFLTFVYSTQRCRCKTDHSTNVVFANIMVSHV